MRFACGVTKAADTHSEYLILLHFRGNNGCANAPKCHVIRTMPVFYCDASMSRCMYIAFLLLRQLPVI
jgi:hypothetical protein